MKLDIQPAGGRWTYEEFAKLPDEHRERYEVIAGELYVTRTPSPLHQEVVMSLLFEIHRFAEAHRLGTALPGPVDVLFAIGDFMAPDALFIRHDRERIITDRAIEGGTPDLIIEVVSAVTAERDRGIKRERYALHGVPEYWVVDPKLRTVEIYRDGADVPEVVTGRWCWKPVPDGPVLELNLPKLLADYDELDAMIRGRQS